MLPPVVWVECTRERGVAVNLKGAGWLQVLISGPAIDIDSWSHLMMPVVGSPSCTSPSGAVILNVAKIWTIAKNMQVSARYKPKVHDKRLTKPMMNNDRDVPGHELENHRVQLA